MQRRSFAGGLTHSLKARFLSSEGEINSYHEVTLATLHMNSCMNKQVLSTDYQYFEITTTNHMHFTIRNEITNCS